MKLTRHPDNPILRPNPTNDWESLVATNPGVWRDEATGDVIMLYRGAGADPEHRIYLGLARSADGVHFERMSDRPVLGPSADGFDAGCVEDPRVIKMGEWYYVTYATRPFPPGQYWLGAARAFKAPACPPDFPAMLRNNASLTGLGLTRDFKTWIRAGLLTHPEDDNRDVILFPERVNGKYWMMHRPANLVGPEFGLDNPAIWISSSDDLMSWDRGTVLAKGEFAWENGKIGGNTPPLRTALGWLTIYHAVGQDKRYRLGALVLDADDPRVVRFRSRDWLLQPEEWYELEGYYPGVCFPCGKVVIGDTLHVYYGGADKYVGLATCPLGELLAYLERCPA